MKKLLKVCAVFSAVLTFTTACSKQPTESTLGTIDDATLWGVAGTEKVLQNITTGYEDISTDAKIDVVSARGEYEAGQLIIPSETPAETPAETPSEETLDEDGCYTTPEDVALYIHTYGKLPCNFITKNEAKKLGWVSNKGNLWDVTDQMSIGGDRFGNYEGLLPDAEGRKWTECDVNYEGGFRGSERILFSNDGLIYYTDDHYKSFTQLY